MTQSRYDTSVLADQAAIAAGISATGLGAPNGIHFFDRTKYLKTRSALAGVVAGTRRMRLGCMGDSITAAYGATASDSGYANMQPNSWPTRLAALLNGMGIPSTNGAFWGFQGIASPTSHLGFDPRISLGTNWSGAGTTSLGGAALFFPTSGGTAAASFTPTAAFDSLRVWYVSGAGNGSVAVNVDGGASLGTINTSGGGTLGNTSYSVTAGTHTVNLVPSNGQLNILGIETWLSTAPRVEVFNFGVNGAKVEDKLVTTNAWAAKNMITGLAGNEPIDLWIISLDVNNSNQQTDLATYQANLATLVSTCQGAGADVILMGGPPSNGYESYRAPYVAAEKVVAQAAGVAFIDQNALIGTAAAGVSAGLYYSDQVHLAARGLATSARLPLHILNML